MPYELFLAFRHLRSRQKGRLARVTALLAVGGIAIGVAALIVALALANGFRDEMRDKILQGSAHLTVMRGDGQPMADYRQVAARIAQVQGVISATGTTYDGALVIGPAGSAYAVLRGVDGSSEQTVADIGRSVTDGSLASLFEIAAGPPAKPGPVPNVILGSELATRTGLKVGALGEIISANQGLSAKKTGTNHVRVSGIFRTGLYEYDATWVYLPLDTAAIMAGGSHSATVVSVHVENIYAVKETAAVVRQALGSRYTIVDWQDANRPLFTALALERRIGVVIIALIILTAALNITTTLVLVVMERRLDIAIINAMGATRRSIMGIFVIEGAIVGLVGASLGVVFGIVATIIANRYRLISLPGDVYSISHVPLNFQWRDVLVSAVVALVLTIIATIYPAYAAARVRPAQMFRDA